jgi:membrane protease YdiL (CAAX protease family)
MKKSLLTALFEFAILNVVGVLLVGLLTVLGGASSYYAEVEQNRASLSGYIAALILYASAVEGSLRFLQARLAVVSSLRFSIVAPAILYGFLHLHHSMVGALYAFLLGLFVAWRASRQKRIWLFVMWHIQWDLGALIVALAANSR